VSIPQLLLPLVHGAAVVVVVQVAHPPEFSQLVTELQPQEQASYHDSQDTLPQEALELVLQLDT
jgi:hypothetical protein